MDQWSITILGDPRVGKSALAIQIWDPTMEGPYRKQLIVDNRPCFVDVDDAPGQEEHATSWINWEGHGFILMYSITSRRSFDRLESFLQVVKRVKGDEPIVVLVGNKCDRPDNEREVSKEEGAARARQLGCQFFETSAKTAQNVERVFLSLIRALRETRNQELERGRPTAGRKRKCIIL
ncbi:ras protein [Mycena haematopus]|nr:ras protein [Mycena haematopus]